MKSHWHYIYNFITKDNVTNITQNWAITSLKISILLVSYQAGLSCMLIFSKTFCSTYWKTQPHYNIHFRLNALTRHILYSFYDESEKKNVHNFEKINYCEYLKRSYLWVLRTGQDKFHTLHPNQVVIFVVYYLFLVLL